MTCRFSNAFHSVLKHAYHPIGIHYSDTRYNKYNSLIPELNRLETLQGKKREKTFKSFTDWIQLEMKRRSQAEVTNNLEFDDWIQNGLQLVAAFKFNQNSLAKKSLS